MLQDLNQTLNKLLDAELSEIGMGRVEISFAAPDSEFATKIEKLVINFFLYDIRENLELRGNNWSVQRQSDGTALKYQPPVRLDCSYLITVWSKSKSHEEEYKYLGKVIDILLRYPKIPNEFLQGSLHGKESPLPTSVLRPPQSQNWTEFWQTMGGKPRTILNYCVTIALDIHEPTEAGKLVQESIVNYEVKH